jgi:NAD+ synthase (glutamine-hydrolysing)
MNKNDFILNGLRIRICQMKVVPGRPDLNAAYVIEQIHQAIMDGIDLIIFPEMCIPGYLIGDMPEDDWFIADVQGWNWEICKETVGSNIIAIFGSILSVPGMIGEDGRLRKHNAALVVQNGNFIGPCNNSPFDAVIKSLNPNYRMFDDERHMVSARKLVGMIRAELKLKHFELEDLLGPVLVDTRIGKLLIPLFVCEDGWDEDYAQKIFTLLMKLTAEIEKLLLEKGEKVGKLAIDISCSPTGWQKNPKRHRVMKKHLVGSDMHLIYVNNTGIQNNGKNIIIFDGSSTVYGPEGEIVFEIPPYVSGCRDIVISDHMAPIQHVERSDTEELVSILECAAGEMVEMLPRNMRRIVIPISGGIDSGLSAASWGRIVGRENLVLRGLPSENNDDELNKLAEDLANNIGADYDVISIQEMFKMIEQYCKVAGAGLTRQNIQPKLRMLIASTIAQQIGGVFPCNSNKVEIFFGYGTQYGDIAGFVTLFGDIVKREIYQVSDNENRVKYRREVIPERCFTVAPTAALEPGQKDPFDYGNLDRRGFHDELVRAVTEFRRNPEWFLEQYLLGDLEQHLKLDPGHLKTLFPTAKAFVKNIEWCWEKYHEAYRKRVQAPPIPIVSKRAFGYDLRESMVSPHFTRRYQQLKRELLET